MALSASGYITPSAEVQFPDQPDVVLKTIRLIIGPGTIALLLVSLPFAWWYPITREDHARLIDEIRDGAQGEK